MASSGSDNSLFSLPSTAHFGAQSPSEDLGATAAMLAVGAPAVQVSGGDPSQSTGGSSDHFTIGSATTDLLGDAALVAATQVPTPPPPTTTSSSTYAPARTRARSASLPRRSGPADAARAAPTVPNMGAMGQDSAKKKSEDNREPLTVSQASLSNGGGNSPDRHQETAASAASVLKLAGGAQGEPNLSQASLAMERGTGGARVDDGRPDSGAQSGLAIPNPAGPQKALGQDDKYVEHVADKFLSAPEVGTTQPVPQSAPSSSSSVNPPPGLSAPSSLASWNVVSDPHGGVAGDSAARGRAKMDEEIERYKREAGEGLPAVSPKRSKSPSVTRLGNVALGVSIGDAARILAPPLPAPPPVPAGSHVEALRLVNEKATGEAMPSNIPEQIAPALVSIPNETVDQTYERLFLIKDREVAAKTQAVETLKEMVSEAGPRAAAAEAVAAAHQTPARVPTRGAQCAHHSGSAQ